LHDGYSVNTTAFKPLRPTPVNGTTSLDSGAGNANGGINGVSGNSTVTYDTLDDFEAVNDEYLANNATQLQLTGLVAPEQGPMYYIPKEVMRFFKVHVLEAIDNIFGHY